jgi:predicted PurR-regulated permease PerM
LDRGMMQMVNKIEIDTQVIWKVFFYLALIWLAILIYDILLYLFIAYIIMSAINPLVERFSVYRMPRWLATLVIFSLVVLVLSIFLTLSLTPFIVQTRTFLLEFPHYVEKFLVKFNLESLLNRQDVYGYLQGWLQGFSNEITTVPLNVLRYGANIFGGFLDFITILVFTFYLVIERDFVHRTLVLFVPEKNKARIRSVMYKVEERLGAWLRGQLTLMFIIGVVTYIGLSLIGMPFALPLALIAGFLEIVPIIGPIISAIPALLVGIAISPIQAITVLFLYILIQQLENSVVVPRVMKQAVGLDSLVVIIALMIGGRLAGPMGSLLSVPATAVLSILYHEWKRTDQPLQENKM